LRPAGTDRADRQDPAPPYDYRRESTRAFDDAVSAVEQALIAHGFMVRVIHDIQATLAAKGFRVLPIRIYEIEGTPQTVATICGDAPPRSADRLMPCRINVFVEDESTVITALRPTLLCRMFPEELLEEQAVRLEALLLRVVDDATV
jgi:uncharacterized protein (DUF302 family)